MELHTIYKKELRSLMLLLLEYYFWSNINRWESKRQFFSIRNASVGKKKTALPRKILYFILNFHEITSMILEMSHNTWDTFF